MRHYVPLVNYANSFLGDDALAEDLVQDVFMHLWNKNKELTLNGKMQTYLFTAVRNKAFENKRAEKAYKKALNGYSQEGSGVSDTDEMSSVSNEYMRKEQISSLLRHLPTKCQNVFALHKLNGLTYAEIAAKEGISIKTVENHMLKAMKILRHEYSKS